MGLTSLEAGSIEIETQPLLLSIEKKRSRGDRILVGNLILEAILFLCAVSGIVILCLVYSSHAAEHNNIFRSSNTSCRDNSTFRCSPIVTISQGDLQGAILSSRGGRDYFVFYNIPYGAPPVGKLRFQVEQQLCIF
jgi:hypothetical protein